MAAPSTEQERELLVQGLMSLQTGCEEGYVRQILKKHGWNADQAATALLDVVTVEEEKTSHARASTQGGTESWINAGALNSSKNPTPVQQRQNSVIDLTGDDDEETAKALVASMETQPVFGPSNRVDDAQQWAVVPSNAPPALSQEDQALNRALEASLTSSFVGASQEPYEEVSDPVERVRKEGWPTALRTTNSALCYAPVVLQCLLSLPHLRARLLRYSVNYEGSDDQHEFSQRLQRLAAIVTHTARSYVAVDEILEALGPLPSSNQDTLPSATLHYFASMAVLLEQIPRPQGDPSVEVPLLSFEGTVTDDSATETSNYRSATHIEVSVPSASGNDLVSCVTDSFTTSDVCLTQLSECVVFLVRRQDAPASTGLEKLPFKYPPRLYLDRFMRENLERASELRNCQEGIHHEAQRLATDRFKLASWKNADTLRDLRAAVQYFETVAADGGDAQRKEAHERSRLKLLEIIKQVEANIHHLDSRHRELTADAEKLFDMVDLQKHGYDLHAVIVHDGLFGRNHEYSYTKDDKGRWWKIVDHQVSEVTQDIVLNDPTGFHLGAGPLFLFYSAGSSGLENSPEPHWPRIIRDLVRQDNYTFAAQLPPDITTTLINRSDSELLLFHDTGLEDFATPTFDTIDSVETQETEEPPSSVETDTG